jgi:hypothetical protein
MIDVLLFNGIFVQINYLNNLGRNPLKGNQPTFFLIWGKFVFLRKIRSPKNNMLHQLVNGGVNCNKGPFK